MSTRLTYIRDGAEIYRRSFAIIRAESDLAASKVQPNGLSFA